MDLTHPTQYLESQPLFVLEVRSLNSVVQLLSQTLVHKLPQRQVNGSLFSSINFEFELLKVRWQNIRVLFEHKPILDVAHLVEHTHLFIQSIQVFEEELADHLA